MITREQAIRLCSGEELHYGECIATCGPRGGVRQKIERWRVNGRTKVWAKSPARFHVPIKYGFRGPYSYLTEDNANEFHRASECALQKVTVIEIPPEVVLPYLGMPASRIHKAAQTIMQFKFGGQP